MGNWFVNALTVVVLLFIGLVIFSAVQGERMAKAECEQVRGGDYYLLGGCVYK